MTLEEVFAMPKGIMFEEYEKLINEKHKLEKQIRRASEIIFEEEDSLEVLEDEVGSDRYNKHLMRRQRAKSRREKAMLRYKEIENRLAR